mmetsp:Transcript_151/g.370  ORF Transcript_151/g.370 Transcript_151/m.370 type:complete len:103 (-) Transcript_151:803-1111(-)
MAHIWHTKKASQEGTGADRIPEATQYLSGPEGDATALDHGVVQGSDVDLHGVCHHRDIHNGVGELLTTLRGGSDGASLDDTVCYSTSTTTVLCLSSKHNDIM